jgi:hypothetical protein
MERKWGHQHEKWGLEQDRSDLHEEIKWETLSGQELRNTIIKITVIIVDCNTGIGSPCYEMAGIADWNS